MQLKPLPRRTIEIPAITAAGDKNTRTREQGKRRLRPSVKVAQRHGPVRSQCPGRFEAMHQLPPSTEPSGGDDGRG